MYRYLPFKERLYSDDLGYYETFGIKVLNENSQEVMSISDVTPDKALITCFCNKCSDEQLSPIHLCEVLDDNL